MSFQDLGLSAPMLRAVADAGYTTATPVQMQAIPPILEGRDLLGCSQTGTGKTAAFALPILQNMSGDKGAAGDRQRRKIRALILAPTRELAAQIGDNFTRLGRPVGKRTAVIFGGVNQLRQTRELQRGVDVLVATPGRLLDLYNQGFLDFSGVEVAVLDEADHMLDMGFLPDVQRILAKLPRNRQSLLFSATMPADIRELADKFLNKPVRISIAPEQPAVEKVSQAVYMASGNQKLSLLIHLLENRPAGKTLVFTRTKRGANRISERLEKTGIESNAIHGNKSQNARQRALDDFKSGRVNVLVATDIAARGIDVRGIDYVVNYDFPETPETYIHRIGRTGRAGLSGDAISFCSSEERLLMTAVERHLKTRLMIRNDGPAELQTAGSVAETGRGRGRQTTRPRNGQARGGRGGIRKTGGNGSDSGFGGAAGTRNQGNPPSRQRPVGDGRQQAGRRGNRNTDSGPGNTPGGGHRFISRNSVPARASSPSRAGSSRALSRGGSSNRAERKPGRFNISR